MQCPECRQTLRGIDYEGVHIESCPSCGGDWLDPTELGHIVEARDRRFNQEECLAIAKSATIAHVHLKDLDRQLSCPKCSNATHPVNYGADSGIIIDKCNACGGVWLDGGELEKIQQLVEGWDDMLPADLKKYNSRLKQISVREDQNDDVHISHVRLINSMINGVLDFLGE